MASANHTHVGPSSRHGPCPNTASVDRVSTRLPSPGPLVGPNLVASELTPDDLLDLARIAADERVYSQGYVMHHRPSDEADALQLVRRWLGSEQDGRGQGRRAYAFRLGEGSALGAPGRLVGTSSLGEAHLEREQVHLGWTIYHPDFWGTGANAEAKWLLMREAFEGCGLGRVKIQTDILNTRSQAAIAKLGAVREGVLRRDQPREDGSWRDTVVFSVLADEWPTVKAGLEARFA